MIVFVLMVFCALFGAWLGYLISPIVSLQYIVEMSAPPFARLFMMFLTYSPIVIGFFAGGWVVWLFHFYLDWAINGNPDVRARAESEAIRRQSRGRYADSCDYIRARLHEKYGSNVNIAALIESQVSDLEEDIISLFIPEVIEHTTADLRHMFEQRLDVEAHFQREIMAKASTKGILSLPSILDHVDILQWPRDESQLYKILSEVDQNKFQLTSFLRRVQSEFGDTEKVLIAEAINGATNELRKDLLRVKTQEAVDNCEFLKEGDEQYPLFKSHYDALLNKLIEEERKSVNSRYSK